MGQMKLYFLEKLSAINYRMANNEKDANSRIASEGRNILLLPTFEVPERYKEDYTKLIQLIKATMENLPSPGLMLGRLNHIQNRTAAKYIKLLINIESSLKD